MRIDVTEQLKKLDGSPMITGSQVCPKCGGVVGEEKPMTLCLAATRALSVTFSDEQNLAPEKKVERFHLALRLLKENSPDLTAEEIVTIKNVVGKMFGNVIVGRAWAILDPPKEAE